MPKWFLDKTCKKNSKIEKLNINIKFCIFKLVYSWVPNRRGVDVGKRGCIFKLVYCWLPNRRGVSRNKRWVAGGIENVITGVGWRKFIWYVKIECKETEAFWVANDRQNTSGSGVRSSKAFNKNINKHSVTSAKWDQ